MEKKYYIFGFIPVIQEIFNTHNIYYAYQWETGSFIQDMSYMEKLHYSHETDVVEKSEEEFYDYIHRVKKDNSDKNFESERQVIIELGLAAVKQAYKVEPIPYTANAAKKMVNLFVYNSNGHYERNGWSFFVRSAEEDAVSQRCFFMDFLDDGTPVTSFESGEDDRSRPIMWYVIEDKKFKLTDRETFLEHHNFDFEKDFRIKKY